MLQQIFYRHSFLLFMDIVGVDDMHYAVLSVDCSYNYYCEGLFLSDDDSL